MHQLTIRLPAFRQNAIQRPQREMSSRIQFQHLGSFQICRDTERIPSGVNGFIDVRRGAF
jgi:hypothetical protein